MPILKIQTNQPPENSQELKQEATRMLSELLGKPAGFIMIILEGANMHFAGEGDPCLFAELKSIGLPEERTTEFSEALCSFFENRLGVHKSRIYIEFTSSERHLLGWNGKTFQK
jgi:phenylpyruvate tautomerase PptA (4-oxalocrotonate tautomerase family)